MLHRETSANGEVETVVFSLDKEPNHYITTTQNKQLELNVSTLPLRLLSIVLRDVSSCGLNQMGRAKRIWYLSHMRAAKVQASLRIRAVSPEPPLLAHTSSESRGTFRQKARSLAPLNGWACAVKVCHDGMLEDTNSLDSAQMYDLMLLLTQ